MNRLPWLWLGIMLGVLTGIDSARGDDPPGTDAAPPKVLKAPAKYKIGDVGDRIREIQATLNRQLTKPEENRVIKLPSNSRVFPVRDGPGDPRGTGPRLLLNLDTGRIDLRIREEWKPCTEAGVVIDDDDEELLEKANHLLMPEHKEGEIPLLVDGVFGPHTHAGVIMFQLKMNLPPTGEVDVVTLDKLEPMIPSNWLLASIMQWVRTDWGFDHMKENYPLWIKRTTSIMAAVLILLAAALVYYPARIVAGIPKLLARWFFEPHTSSWFNALNQSKVFVRAAQFAPALFICLAAEFIFPEPEQIAADPFPYLDVFQKCHVFLWRFGLAYAALIGMRVALAYVNACDLVFTGGENGDNPVKRITRAVKRLVALVGLVLIWSALAWKNPMYFVGGLGAFMAILLLVFRGTILGLVASVQIVANKMVRIGDWIEVPAHAANGTVEEISLTTVKVRNFDQSISMIPMAGLLSESFHNWSEMERAGGRRIKRSIHIDIESILICTPDLITEFEKIELIRDYLRDKKSDLDDYNKEHDVDASPVNSRRLTNIGTFRAYIEAYLRTHPRLRTDFMHLVRQLQPCEHGLPIEVSIFCRDTDWPTYEAVQADIFDHLLSILPEFRLRAFQELKSL